MTGPLDAGRERVNRALDRCLPSATREPTRLHEAMRYAVEGGGKRVRGCLVYASGAAFGAGRANDAMLDAAACAVEIIHAYSLVHDDLPAMDDDDLRRGQPTCHRAFDEATALLAGDALQAFAFEVLVTARSDGAPPLDAARRLEMVRTLAQASGPEGMAGGQAIDLASVGQPLPLAALEQMHSRKTGALIAASVRLGALCAPAADDPALAALAAFARNIGLAFQVHDDVLDVSGSTEELGKRSGADAALDKPTFPSTIGLEASRNRTVSLCDDALAALEPFGDSASALRAIAQFIVTRSH